MNVNGTDKIALFDMDGSLANFAKALHEDLEAMRSPVEPPIPTEGLFELEKIPYMNARMKAIKRRPGWWRGLERIELGFTVLRLAAQIGFEINVLTKGPLNNPNAWAEKLQWCDAQPELHGKQVHITMNKGLVYGAFLYDDFPEYMNQWLEHRPRGLGIMPVNELNVDYQHPRVIKWDGSQLEEIGIALETVFNRKPRETLVLQPIVESRATNG